MKYLEDAESLKLQSGIKVISKKNVSLANEPSIQKYAEGIKELEGVKVLEYHVFHNKEPYIIG